MARAKDLAALAGLAGLAYAMRDKSGKDDAGDQKTSSYTKDTKKVEAKDEPFKATHGSSYTPGNAGTARSGVGSATNDPIVKPVKTRSIKAEVDKNPASTADKPAELTTPVSSANRTDQLANLSRAVKREDKTKKAAQDDFRGYTKRTYTSPGPYGSIQEVQKLNDTLEGRAGANTSSARKTDALRVASRAAAAADRQRKMAKASSYKSGGMTASNRADGIATKGKTRGKIC